MRPWRQLHVYCDHHNKDPYLLTMVVFTEEARPSFDDPCFRVLGRSRCIEKVFGFGVFGPRYGVLPRGRGPWCRVSKLDRDVFAKSYRFLAREKR